MKFLLWLFCIKTADCEWRIARVVPYEWQIANGGLRVAADREWTRTILGSEDVTGQVNLLI